MHVASCVMHRALYHRPTLHSLPRTVVALALHLMREVLLVQFVSASSILLGTGDGAFNVRGERFACVHAIATDACRSHR